MTMSELKAELQEVRCYYRHKAMFDNAIASVTKNEVLEKVERYNELVKDAPALFYCLYIALYVENNTQFAVAQNWKHSEGYIKNLNGRFCRYLLEKLNQKEGRGHDGEDS